MVCVWNGRHARRRCRDAGCGDAVRSLGSKRDSAGMNRCGGATGEDGDRFARKG